MNEPVVYNPDNYPVPVPQQHNSVDDFKNVVIFSIISVGSAIGLFYLGRSFVQKAQKDQVQKDSVTEGEPANYAAQFKQAFENDNWMGWGTDNTLLFNTILVIPTKQAYGKVQDAYQKLYNRSLNADLEDELSSSEYNRFILILSSKPES